MNEIQTLRKDAGLSQAELAEKLGIEQSTVSRWESGEVPVKTGWLIAVKQIVAEVAS